MNSLSRKRVLTVRQTEPYTYSSSASVFLLISKGIYYDISKYQLIVLKCTKRRRFDIAAIFNEVKNSYSHTYIQKVGRKQKFRRISSSGKGQYIFLGLFVWRFIMLLCIIKLMNKTLNFNFVFGLDIYRTTVKDIMSIRRTLWSITVINYLLILF